MKKLITICFAIMAILGFVSLTNSAIIPIGPFTGQISEGFETHPYGIYPEISVLNGEGTVRVAGQFWQGICVSYVWMASGGGLVTPHSGELFMGGAGNALEWVFNVPVKKFGGYFTTLYVEELTQEHAVAKIFDTEDNLLGEINFTSPYNNQWTWNGWSSDVPMKRVQIIGFGTTGGFVMHDDMEFTPIPEPATIAMLSIGSLALIRRKK